MPSIKPKIRIRFTPHNTDKLKVRSFHLRKYSKKNWHSILETLIVSSYVFLKEPFVFCFTEEKLERNPTLLTKILHFI